MKYFKNKKTVFIIILLCLSLSPAYAATCNGLLTVGAAELISEVIGYIRIGVPILLIILCATDLSTVVLSGDDKAMKVAASRIMKRFIAAVAIFFVPLIVSVVLNLEPVKNSLNLVDDPTCGIATGDTEGLEEGVEYEEENESTPE